MKVEGEAVSPDSCACDPPAKCVIMAPPRISLSSGLLLVPLRSLCCSEFFSSLFACVRGIKGRVKLEENRERSGGTQGSWKERRRAEISVKYVDSRIWEG